MIAFDPTPEHDALRQRIETFVMGQIAPYEKDPRNTAHGPTEELRIELDSLARDASLFAPQVPQQWGGMGLDHVSMAIAFEACGLSPLGPIAMHCAAPDEGNMNLLDKVATEAQKERWLKPFAAGDFHSCFSMTEPWGAGSDLSEMKTKARYDGDDFVVSGVKWLITGAKGAGFTIIFCDVEPDGDKPGGPTMFISDMDAPGIELSRELESLDSSFICGHWEVTFKDLRISEENVLGEVGEGFRYVQVRLAPARLTHCMRWLGGAVRAQRIALDYARKREAFGKPIGQYGEIGAMLAENEMELQQCRLMVWWACALLDKGEHGWHESSMVKTSARLCTKIAQVRAQKIPLAATSSRACSRRKMIPRKSPIPCHRFRWNLDHPQTRHTKIYNIQLFNYPIYLPNSAGPKIRATVQPHFLNSTLCIE